MNDNLHAKLAKTGSSPRQPLAHPKATASSEGERATWSVNKLLTVRRLIVDELEQRRKDYQNMLVSLDHALLSGHGDPGEDVADMGTRAFENDQTRYLMANRREVIGQLERALERIDDGSYGRCEDCLALIPTARLEAYPAANLCVACKMAGTYR